MKQKVVFLMSIMFMALVVVGCSSDENTQNEENAKSSFSVENKCYQSIIANNTNEENSIYEVHRESIQYEATENGELMLKHVNAIFSCESEISVNTTIKDGIISVVEHGTNDTNCICPYDITVNIAPLNIRKYEIIIYNDNREYTHFSIDFNTSLKGEFTINNK